MSQQEQDEDDDMQQSHDSVSVSYLGLRKDSITYQSHDLDDQSL